MILVSITWLGFAFLWSLATSVFTGTFETFTFNIIINVIRFKPIILLFFFVLFCWLFLFCFLLNYFLWLHFISFIGLFHSFKYFRFLKYVCILICHLLKMRYHAVVMWQKLKRKNLNWCKCKVINILLYFW